MYRGGKRETEPLRKKREKNNSENFACLGSGQEQKVETVMTVRADRGKDHIVEAVKVREAMERKTEREVKLLLSIDLRLESMVEKKGRVCEQIAQLMILKECNKSNDGNKNKIASLVSGAAKWHKKFVLPFIWSENRVSCTQRRELQVWSG